MVVRLPPIRTSHTTCTHVCLSWLDTLTTASTHTGEYGNTSVGKIKSTKDKLFPNDYKACILMSVYLMTI